MLWPQVVLICAALAGAVVLFATFTRHVAEWWRLIPAWTLLALGGIVALTLLPGTERFMAALVFLGLACGFAHSYLLDRWRALVGNHPGGFMSALGGVLAAAPVPKRSISGGSALFLSLLGAASFFTLLAGSAAAPMVGVDSRQRARHLWCVGLDAEPGERTAAAALVAGHADLDRAAGGVSQPTTPTGRTAGDARRAGYDYPTQTCRRARQRCPACSAAPRRLHPARTRRDG